MWDIEKLINEYRDAEVRGAKFVAEATQSKGIEGRIATIRMNAENYIKSELKKLIGAEHLKEK